METRSSRTKVETKKVKRKKLNIARTLVFVLFVYLFVSLVMYILKVPVRHFEIKGNNLVSDADILRDLKLDNYPSFFSINIIKVRKKLLKNELISDAKIKYKWGLVLEIDIEENRPLMIIKSNNKVLLSDGNLIENKGYKVPVLLNDTPEAVLNKLAERMIVVDEGILSMISEIEYQPSYSTTGEVIDANRFLLYMSDDNLVYVTANNIKKLNNYLNVIATSSINGKGTLYLDGNEDRYPFILFGA